MDQQSDRTLVGDFLQAIRGRTGSWVEEHVSGVTANDVSRWRRDEWKSLSEPKRQALRNFIMAGRGFWHEPGESLDLENVEPSDDLLEDAIADLSSREEDLQAFAERVGVDLEHVTKWKDGERHSMDDRTRASVRTFLENEQVIKTGEGYPSGSTYWRTLHETGALPHKLQVDDRTHAGQRQDAAVKASTDALAAVKALESDPRLVEIIKQQRDIPADIFQQLRARLKDGHVHLVEVQAWVIRLLQLWNAAMSGHLYGSQLRQEEAIRGTSLNFEELGLPGPPDFLSKELQFVYAYSLWEMLGKGYSMGEAVDAAMSISRVITDRAYANANPSVAAWFARGALDAYTAKR